MFPVSYTHLRNVVTDFENYIKLWDPMCLKIIFLDSCLDFFPENLRAVNEQCECLHQKIATTENGYQGKWSPSMLPEYCWAKKRDIPDTKCNN